MDRMKSILNRNSNRRWLSPRAVRRGFDQLRVALRIQQLEPRLVQAEFNLGRQSHRRR
jgi:hypothetical protein